MLEEDPYGISRWNEGYFEINSEGHVVIKPHREGPGGDLYMLMRSLVAQGVEPPFLIRFNGILRDRLHTLNNAFRSAIQEFQYRNGYRMVFPVKVNPHRHVVETVVQEGKHYDLGLEVGSKPELMAVLALEHNPEALLLCNGYKDAEYISLALMGQQLGRKTMIIIEQGHELKLVLEAARELNLDASIGFRLKLSHTGTGRWQSSGGEHSKFGLLSHEIVSCLELLKANDKTHWVQLLHFHMGSQITSIESIKWALKEGARMYVELAAQLPSLSYFDVGGGLAVDYDGSKSMTDSSMNYTLEEYARDVVSTIGEACRQANLKDPIIITESGRALLTHHAVLVTEVIDVISVSPHEELPPPPSNHEIIQSLIELKKSLSLKNCRETYHDAMELKEQILQQFIYGTMSLPERAYAEKLISRLLKQVHAFYFRLPQKPEEWAALEKALLETYFCNFSVFQSLPDSWAIGQLFPILPIHRLHEQSDHQAVLADLTCDSDGKIDSFIGTPSVQHALPLHEYRGEPYYIGIFLVGAYQEILGGLHNLFGDTNVVHAELNDAGQWELSRLVEGDTIEEVLSYVQYNTENMKHQLYELLEQGLKAGRIQPEEAAKIKKKFKQSLESYTYLVV